MLSAFYYPDERTLEKEGDKLVFLQTILMSTTMNYSKLARGHYIFPRDILD